MRLSLVGLTPIDSPFRSPRTRNTHAYASPFLYLRPSLPISVSHPPLWSSSRYCPSIFPLCYPKSLFLCLFACTIKNLQSPPPSRVDPLSQLHEPRYALSVRRKSFSRTSLTTRLEIRPGFLTRTHASRERTRSNADRVHRGFIRTERASDHRDCLWRDVLRDRTGIEDLPVESLRRVVTSFREASEGNDEPRKWRKSRVLRRSRQTFASIVAPIDGICPCALHSTILVRLDTPGRVAAFGALGRRWTTLDGGVTRVQF